MVRREVGEGAVVPDGRHEELGRVGGRLPAHDENAWNIVEHSSRTRSNFKSEI